MTDQNNANGTADGFGSLIVQETSGQNIVFHNNTTELSAVPFDAAQGQNTIIYYSAENENAG